MESPRSSIIRAGVEREPIRGGAVRWNPNAAVLAERALRRHEAVLAQNGALAGVTAHFTGRSPRTHPSSPPARRRSGGGR